MALVRCLSNPSGSLKVVLDQSRWDANEAVDLIPPPQPCSSADVVGKHPHPGRVLKAVEQVLADHGEPMQAKAIHTAAEMLVGGPVSWSSVKNALAANVSGPSPRFVRVAKGRYGLAAPH